MHKYSNRNELRILMSIKLIFLSIVEHQDSLQNQDRQQLGNGRLYIAALLFVSLEVRCKPPVSLGKDLFPYLKVPLDVRCLGMKIKSLESVSVKCRLRL